MSDIEFRLQRCERTNRVLSVLVVLSSPVIMGIQRHEVPNTGTVRAQGQPALITASELAIVDANGVVRVRIGTKLPDAVIKGTPRPRGDQAAGLILYDETGQERGGYVTFSPSGYVGLTVDSREQMVGSFMAGPTGGAMLQIRNGGLVQLRRDKDWIELRADESGPHMNTRRTGQLTSRTPSMSAEEVRFVCSKLKEELIEKAKMSQGQAVQACNERKDGRTKLALLWAAEKAVRAVFGLYTRAIGLEGYHLPDMDQVATISHQYYDNHLRGGEGHMEVGKLVQTVARRKAHMVISVKPFGCMPSSGVSDGVQSLITARYPQAIFTAIETTGDGEVNAQSRIQMDLFKARQRAEEEFRRAVRLSGLNDAALPRRLGRRRRALHHPPHVVAGTAANQALELGGVAQWGE